MLVKPKAVTQLRYPLPKTLVAAAGMLKGKLPNGVAYQKNIRKQWEQRLRKLGHK